MENTVTNTNLPFEKGVNFTRWFEVPSPQKISTEFFTEQDFKNAKKLGADVIRLPIRLHSMTGGAPDYTLDPLFFERLDQAADWAEQNRLYLILDNHSFDPVAATSPEIVNILIPVWQQMARHYKGRSQYILYEVLNEPHRIEAAVWAEIQGKVVKAIRAIDTSHSIIVGGVNYNSINEMLNVPIYDDANIIYTFHFYDPHIFTHQGETWGVPPNLKNLRGLPFPSDAHAMPEIPADLKDSWADKIINETYAQDATAQALAKQLDKAVQYSKEHGGVPLFCGEFGVHIPNALPEDRVRWYQTTTKLLEERGIARTSWDYYGSFGIFKTSRGGSFDTDLNVDVVNALGFTAP